MPKFVPRKRKQRDREKERARQHQSATAPGGIANSNTAEIVPSSKTEREERREQLKKELQAQQPKISSKKQKRLDKYIDTKLKKDENQALIKKLSESRVDTSLFKSTKKLGQSSESKREIFSRALREKEAGINVEHANKILYDQRKKDSSSEDEDEVEIPTPVVQQNNNIPNGQSFGTGLKRPLDVDEEGRPIIKKRKRSKTKPISIILPPPVIEEELEESEWEGFNSETESEGQSDMSGSQSKIEEAVDLNNEKQEDSNSEDEDDDSDDSEESQDDQTSEDEADQTRVKKKARASAFKAWAEQQRNEAIGFVPSNALSELPSSTPKFQHISRPLEQDPLPFELEVNPDSKRTAHAVHVERSEEIQTARLALPVVAEEQKIMEAIFNHDVVIISGATGSGKTTQVPQFLFENGFGDPAGPTPGLIGVTQPRRVAAVSMAKRVSDELGDAKDRVAHQIRFDTTVSKRTAIKFMTDGVLLREMADDFSLKKYSAIIIDEAHERTVNTDILISLMSRCIKARMQLSKEKPKSYVSLKLVIMSATLRISDFRENPRLFSTPPPLVTAEGRQFDVAPHWSRKTYHNYTEEAFKKVSRGHRKLPPGGILVFLTGQNEIRTLARQLKEAFSSTEALDDRRVPLRVSAAEMPVESEDLDLLDVDQNGQSLDFEEEESESDLENENFEDPDSEFKIDGEEAGELLKVHVLPLYSQLPSKDQLRVFEPPPEGSRLIVLATNVAETSLTIPGIRYVFDSGRVKERKWDRAGVQTFETTWVSKASADQRMGRAGRTGAGHCYRLYSSAVYETFKDFAEPEIYRSPLEGVVLQLKALNITRVDKFPFPTPPDRASLVKAEALLSHLGALNRNGTISPLGRELQNYPLNPRFAQMLRLSQMHNCVELAIAMVAALDVPEILIPESMLDLQTPVKDEDAIWTEADNQEETRRSARRKAYNAAHATLSSLSPSSDALKLFAAVYMYNEADDPEQMCEETFVRSKALQEANQLRQQLTGIVNNLRPGSVGPFMTKLPKPSDKDLNLLRQIVAAGFVNQVAIRADCLPTPPEEYKKPKRAIDVKYETLMLSHEGHAQQDEDKFVFLHPSSVLARTAPSKLPRYLIYHRLQRSQNSKVGSIPKTRMHPLTPVSGEQLAVIARGTTLLDISKPLGKITVVESVEGRERRQCSVLLSLVGRAGGTGWPLTRKEVIQRREPKEGWIIEKYLDAN